MKMRAGLVVVLLVVSAGAAWGQPAIKDPHIGYLYPAGGQQGTTFYILACGQGLRGGNEVYVTGEGVHASVVKFYRPIRNLDPDQRRELQRRLRAAWETQWVAAHGEGRRPVFPGNALLGKPPGKLEQVAAAVAPTKLPEHPFLDDLDTMDLRGLAYVIQELSQIKKRQQNAQIAEMVKIEVTVDADAAAGDRELRVRTAGGLTNPMLFQVGNLPETSERELNNLRAYPFLPETPPLELPVVLNGQVMPGDVDLVRFEAKKGQRLVIETEARHLVPYLADAVPGWFQPTLTLFDSEGSEIAFADDYRFDPDPVLYFKVPQDGIYELEIRDSIYRGREDFVYRVAISEKPFITEMFPLGGQVDKKAVASVEGWNLPSRRLPLDTESGADVIRQASLKDSNPILYAVDALPECAEKEPNDEAKTAQRVSLPRIVNGRIARPGDVDMFEFEGHAGDEVVAEVCARRLNSPLDSLLRLTDATGHVLEWNDDHDDKEAGLVPHQADSYLCAKLPEDGVYCVQVSDSEQHGDNACAYRLRVSGRQPDFALRVAPSSLNAIAGRSVPLHVYALRKDGFEGEIALTLENAPAGFCIDGGKIPAGQDHVRITLTVPRKPSPEPVAIQITGQAAIGGSNVSRPAVASEDMMQAFAYRHLVPCKELLVLVRPAKRPAPPIEIAQEGPVRIPEGGTAQVQVKIPGKAPLANIQWELNDPPKGVELESATVTGEGLTLALKSDKEVAKAGYADNLIVEAFTEVAAPKTKSKTSGQKQRVSIGALPAIPFEIVQQ